MSRLFVLLALLATTGVARADLILEDTGEDADTSEDEGGCGNKATGTAAASAALGLFLLGRLRRRR